MFVQNARMNMQAQVQICAIYYKPETHLFIIRMSGVVDMQSPEEHWRQLSGVYM